MGVEGETKFVATEQGPSANGAQEEVSSGENLAVWVCGIDDLKMKPLKLPSTLGSLSLSLSLSLSRHLSFLTILLVTIFCASCAMWRCP
jgi:hypothetical protein